jgi:uncharacterized membrane protein YiaA
VHVNEITRLARIGKQAERSKEVRKRYLTHFVMLALRVLVDGWVMMLLVGVVHAEWIRSLPTVGYWWAVLIVTLAGAILGIRSTANTRTWGRGE